MPQPTPSVPGRQRGLATPLSSPRAAPKVLSCASEQISPFPLPTVGVNQFCPQGCDTTSVSPTYTCCIQSKVHSWAQTNETRRSLGNKKGQALLSPRGPQSPPRAPFVPFSLIRVLHLNHAKLFNSYLKKPRGRPSSQHALWQGGAGRAISIVDLGILPPTCGMAQKAMWDREPGQSRILGFPFQLCLPPRGRRPEPSSRHCTLILVQP